MIKFTTIQILFTYVQLRCHLLVILAWLGLAVMGQIPDSSGGWRLSPTVYVSLRHNTRGAAFYNKGQKRRKGRRRKRLRSKGHISGAVVYLHVRQTWRVVGWRSLLLLAGWGLHSGWRGWWVGAVPWLVWGWYLSGLFWSGWGQQPEWRAGRWLGQQIERVVLIGSLSWLLWLGLPKLIEGVWLHLNGSGGASGSYLLLAGGLGCVLGGSNESQVQLGSEVDEAGKACHYTATLQGYFTLKVAADDFFRRRLLILFLRLLEEPSVQRGSRRTRDGRMPAVRQQALSATYGVTQPEISRWERYWQAGDWRRLLSIRASDILTLELQDRVVKVFAQFPWWGVDKVHAYLNEQGVKVSHRQVRQASQESGWCRLRKELATRYHLTKESIRPRDEWLVTQLLSCNSELLARLEAGDRLTPQALVEIIDLTTLTREVVDAPPPLKALPWAFRLERLLLGSWAMVANEQVRCAYCGSTHVARKSNKPRIKNYYDEAGVVQTVEVYRFYCRNADCEKGSFTHLPTGLQLYSPYRVQTHLLAAQLVGWGQVNYRRTAVALAVSPATVYRWVTVGGERLLPVAAIFGAVRSSGVIGIDEKYVLVPKNDKPYPENGRRTMRRWLYVSVAVDCYTCDLLHIAIYPYQNAASSRAFLLALRAKGYRPRVIVTDLLQSYDSIIAFVFPHALHHECVFHALQAVQRSIKSVYGADYGRDAPHAQRLKEDIYAIFDARTRATAVKRYEKVLSLQHQYVTQNPDAEVVFIFLRTHWPKLVNSIGSKTIPHTNNAAERLIRRFDQHYQNFCGFESIDSAQRFIAVFERSYRFTPFSQDAQARIRGKCPLELAGYDISRMPLTAVAAGWSPDWPLETEVNFVPNL